MGGLQIGQVFCLNFTLEDKGDLALSEEQEVMFPSEISKSLYMRFTLKNLQKYDSSFSLIFLRFHSNSNQLRQSNACIRGKPSKRMSLCHDSSNSLIFFLNSAAYSVKEDCSSYYVL